MGLSNTTVVILMLIGVALVALSLSAKKSVQGSTTIATDKGQTTYSYSRVGNYHGWWGWIGFVLTIPALLRVFGW